MNGRTAKKLRKFAAGLATLVEQQGQKIPDIKYERSNQSGSIEVSNNTLRGITNSLKKNLKNPKSASNIQAHLKKL